MKIEIQNGPKEDIKNFYDEFFYIRRKYKKIRKNPKQKIKGITEFTTVYFIFFFVLFLCTLSYTFQFRETIYYFLCFVCFIYIFISIIDLILINKNIKVSIQETSNSIINIDESGIELIKKDNYTAKIEWQMIDKIIINHYSICIFPKQVTSLMIAFHAKYKKEFLEAIKQYQKEELIIDNSHLYQ